jgi:hypothetical protein
MQSSLLAKRLLASQREFCPKLVDRFSMKRICDRNYAARYFPASSTKGRKIQVTFEASVLLRSVKSVNSSSVIFILPAA